MHEDPAALVARLVHLVAPGVDLDRLDRTAPLQDVAGFDSMDFLNLVAALATEIGIEVPERDYPRLATIDGLVRYVRDAQTVNRPR